MTDPMHSQRLRALAKRVIVWAKSEVAEVEAEELNRRKGRLIPMNLLSDADPNCEVLLDGDRR